MPGARPSPRRVIADTLEDDTPTLGSAHLAWCWAKAEQVLRALERHGYEITEIITYDDRKADSYAQVRDLRR